MEPCVEVNRDDFMQYHKYDYWRQFCKVTDKVYRLRGALLRCPSLFSMVLF